jgi:DNA polymerase-3 subunit delta
MARSTPQTASVKELNRAISARALASVYLLYGEEAFLRDAKIARMVEATLEPSEHDFNLAVRHAADSDADELDALLNSVPMLLARRVVVIREVSELKKNARAVLNRYLENPSDQVLLVLTENGAIAKTEKTLSARSVAVEFAKLSEDDTLKWVLHYAQETLSVQIAPDAAKLLLRAVGEDLSQIAGELEKLSSYSGGSRIETADVEDLVGVRHGETSGDLLDAIARRDTAQSLSLLGHVLSQPRTAAVPFVMALTTQMLGVTYARQLLDEGTPYSRLAGELYNFLGAGKGVTGRPWGEAVRSWMVTVKSWSSEQLEAASKALLQADMSLKGPRSSSDEQVLATLILALCVHDDRISA